MNVTHFILMLMIAAIVGWFYSVWYYKNREGRTVG